MNIRRDEQNVTTKEKYLQRVHEAAAVGISSVRFNSQSSRPMTAQPRHRLLSRLLVNAATVVVVEAVIRVHLLGTASSIPHLWRAPKEEKKKEKRVNERHQYISTGRGLRPQKCSKYF